MSTAAAAPGLDRDTLDMTLKSVRDFVTERLPQARMLELDATHECPEAEIRAMQKEGAV